MAGAVVPQVSPKNSGYCGTGCQPNFGTCSGSGVYSTIPSSTLRTSTIPNTRSSSIPPSSTRTSSTAIARSSSTSSVRSSSTSSARSSSTSSARSSSTSSARSSSTSSARSSSTSSVRSSSASPSVQSSSASRSIIPVSSSTHVSSSVSTQVGSSTSSSIAVSSSASSTLVLGSVTSSLASGSPSLISSIATTVSSQTSVDIISTSVAETVPSVVSMQPSSTPTVISPVQIVVNPSFELGDGSDPTDWTVERLYIIDAGASGRVQSNPHTGSYSIRGRGQPNGGYDVYVSQTVTVVPGASYNLEVFAKQTTDGFCSISIYLGERAIREYVPPGTSYTSISAVVDISAGDPAQQTLLIDGACSLPDGNAEMYDLFIDDVTMTLVV
ncbi:hypothetical protein P153DRAFT_430617 [Dothidotthia symphoricarpi CBS 119687]|uniref:Uncharacterized protein n=1 Tax=Dothidotthia symphoricarpi CBS 119687 TaxID=1392245 RepID=A0A6A6AES7_9PLEO|nr:uncharacterized protein P153DRAFT_430617 [Dothidotthia symphoricarpi CBS 119687]KAF2130399.1 hypothetical protein P153DRAFT_430617 [Dothidotthia symphoricarpi CBS 119687]